MLFNNLTAEEAEAWLYEACAHWDAALKEEGEGEDTLREAAAAYRDLGDTFTGQKMDSEAEAAFERALDLKFKQVSCLSYASLRGGQTICRLVSC